MRRLRAAAADDGSRSEALVELLQNNGLRISEAVQSDVDHLGWDRGHRTLRVLRKSGDVTGEPLAPHRPRDRQLPRRPHHGPHLHHIDRRPTRPGSPRTGSSPASPGEPTSQLPTPSPHSLRHSFATAALDASVPLRDVQEAMDHADPRTTRRYDRSRRNLDRHATYVVTALLGDDPENRAADQR